MDDENEENKKGAFTLDDVIGQDYAISEIRSFLNMKMEPKIAEFWKVGIPKGILLTGPPGTGKTMTIRALVNESADYQLAEIKYSEIASKWLDESIVRLSNLFEEIEKAAKSKHVIVFIDEIDSFLPDRSQENLHHSFVALVNTFIQWMDGGLTSYSNVTVIGATNNYNKLDKAAVRPGRFDKVISFNLLKCKDIIELLKLTVSKQEFEENQIEEIDWKLLASRINNINVSGAEASSIIKRITSKKMKEHYNNVNNCSNYSKSVPCHIFMMDDDVCPSPIATSDILRELDLLRKPLPDNQ